MNQYASSLSLILLVYVFCDIIAVIVLQGATVNDLMKAFERELIRQFKRSDKTTIISWYTLTSNITPLHSIFIIGNTYGGHIAFPIATKSY